MFAVIREKGPVRILLCGLILLIGAVATIGRAAVIIPFAILLVVARAVIALAV